MNRIITKVISAASAIAIFAGSLAYTAFSESSVSSGLKDSGISYTETVETIMNPGAGYTQTIWPVCKPGSTPTYSPSNRLVLFFIDIGAFSSGVNGTTDEDGTYHEGTDYDLDKTFFDSWRTTFENCRKNGCMIALRFRYDASGKDNPEPATFEQVLHHISQIRESGLLEEYKDILAFVESGFVGKWGEQHGGKYVSVDYKSQLLDAMLDCVPSPVPVTVRTPDIFAKWAGITRSELADYVCEEGSEASRVGLYDDGYMGSDSDLGTYANRAIETTWLGNQTYTSYFGGEFSGAIDFAKQYDTYLPENAIPEMYKTHLSYINSNIFQLYKDYTFGADCDVDGADNSAYYGQNVFQFIRDHIGYRFVVRKSELSETAEQGGTLDLHFNVENTGFANPVPETYASILLEKDGNYMRACTDIDANKWYSCSTADESISLHIPDALPEGEWNVYLKLEMGDNTIDQMSMRSVRFANENVWNSSLGANYMGSVNITKGTDSDTADNYFEPVEPCSSETVQRQNSCREMYTIRSQIIADGMLSSDSEWTDEMIIGTNGDNTVSMTADNEYFYIMGQLPEGAAAPVYNLRLTREDGESYWIYFQSNGFVYFNHNDGKYDGASCKWSGKTVEFKIPLELFGLEGGTQVKTVRLFLQDSANEWKLLGEVNTDEFAVPEKFIVYSALDHIRCNEAQEYTMSVVTMLENAQYQWYFNGDEISGADGDKYVTDNLQKGIYSVKITAQNGISQTVDITEVVDVISSSRGDVNCDGSVNTADLVLLQKYILKLEQVTAKGYEQADVNTDGQVDSLDLVSLRKILI